MAITKQQEIELFAQVNANNPRFRDMLIEHRDQTMHNLMLMRDPAAIHQFQGRAQLLDEIITKLGTSAGILAKK